MEILAIIPARSGSKGLPDKNILPLDGKPMIAYSIELALASKLITRVIVSTDSEQYMEIAREYGAETPFIRPTEFAQDDSLDIDVFYHALSWLRDNESYVPDICVQLRPCGPVRDAKLVDKIIQRLINNPSFDSIRTVSNSTQLPYKMWHLSEDKLLIPVMRDIPECYNMLRQNLPKTYYQNGYVDAVKPHVVLEQRSMTGKNIGGYIVDEYFDIDYPEDVSLVEACIKIRTRQQSFLIDEECIKNDSSIVEKLKKAGHIVYIKNQEIETDYYISNKTINLSDLEKIICRT
jgi:CMP-N-acetylneuraminic acid synthetase